MKVLVDTSVWSLALRRKPHQLDDQQRDLVLELEGLIEENRAVQLGMVRQEVLSGIRARAVFERLRVAWQAFPDPQLSREDYEEAADVYNRCRTAGIAGGPVDFLLCAVARRRGYRIFTIDQDFERFAGVLALVLHQPGTERS